MELRIDDASASIEVEADVDAVSQVLFNLVDNACKYAHASKPPVIELLASAEGAWLALRVRDHGPGISPAHAKKIFRPFERGQAEAEKERPGAAGIGLGLSLARGLARDMDGDLLYEPGEAGACFALMLPRAPANRREGRRRADDEASLGRVRRGSRDT
jgi:signal transduction histidine kinase